MSDTVGIAGAVGIIAITAGAIGVGVTAAGAECAKNEERGGNSPSRFSMRCSAPGAHVNKASGNCSSSRHRWRHQMRAATKALTAFKVAV